MASIPSRGLLLPLFVAPQIILAAVGMWLFDELGRCPAEAIRTSAAGLEATAGLQQSLFDAERMALFAVIDGERLHPDVRKAFRMCIDQARARLPGAQAPAALPAQLPEAAGLTKRVDEL
ncbi:hypothetical protein, partial [Zavarzinella formosa]|uniref:hypothetical protein n=1 Tax=Zavarzinella formosa TaxID=360055 RepID=UPI0005951106